MRFFGALFFVGTLAISASAATIYDNTTQALGAQDGVYTVGNDVNGNPNIGPLFASFTSSSNATGSVFDSVLLSLFAGDNTDSGHVNVALYSDASGVPGAAITALGTIADTSLANCVGDPGTAICDSTTPTLYNITASQALAASTRYWIGLSTTDGSSALWNWEGDASGTGVAGECFHNASDVAGSDNCPFNTDSFNNSDGAMIMKISATDNSLVVDTTPEPASFLLLGSGALALGFIRRRNKA